MSSVSWVVKVTPNDGKPYWLLRPQTKDIWFISVYDIAEALAEGIEDGKGEAVEIWGH